MHCFRVGGCDVALADVVLADVVRCSLVVVVVVVEEVMVSVAEVVPAPRHLPVAVI